MPHDDLFDHPLPPRIVPPELLALVQRKKRRVRLTEEDKKWLMECGVIWQSARCSKQGVVDGDSGVTQPASEALRQVCLFEEVQMKKDCSSCNGTGKCQVCKGSGHVNYPGYGDVDRYPGRCNACQSSGVCRTCHGTGER
jgi:hypothetical protein